MILFRVGDWPYFTELIRVSPYFAFQCDFKSSDRMAPLQPTMDAPDFAGTAVVDGRRIYLKQIIPGGWHWLR